MPQVFTNNFDILKAADFSRHVYHILASRALGQDSLTSHEQEGFARCGAHSLISVAVYTTTIVLGYSPGPSIRRQHCPGLHRLSAFSSSSILSDTARYVLREEAPSDAYLGTVFSNRTRAA